MGMIIKNLSVKTHQFRSMVEYYYGLLQQVYFIITIEISGIQLNLMF